ncbi:hypothetical protein Tco_1484927 [Tanacetum coccineum]
MSHTSSPHTVHSVSKSGHTASLFKNPTLYSEEELTMDTDSEYEVSSGRTVSAPRPSLTYGLSSSIRQGLSII